jgi:acetate kinase
MNKQLILITNPGSASRKYALYDGPKLLVSLHFEHEDGGIICTLHDSKGKHKIQLDFSDLSETVKHLREILIEQDYIGKQYEITAIAARIVAPSDYLAADHIVDEEFMQHLEQAKQRAPLHVPVIATEIEHFRTEFPDTKIIAVSDSAFHSSRPDLMKYYAIDTQLADQAGIKRYGYHGLSYASIVRNMKAEDILPEKLIVAHLGSGASVAAILNGAAMDTSMGYSPLEGLMMATRSGSIDLAAALAIKRELNLDDDQLEAYLNKKAGLLGTSGFSGDLRDIIKRRDEGDDQAAFTHALYIYRIQNLIGQMAASLGGVNALVFTATIGERSNEIRNYVVQKLSYLGFHIDEAKNKNPEFTGKYANIAAQDSSPIYIIHTEETAEIIQQARKLI